MSALPTTTVEVAMADRIDNREIEQVRAELLNYFTEYVLREFIGEADERDRWELTPDAPLLQWGVFNSMNISAFIGHVREHFGIIIPVACVTGRNFRNLNSLTDLVVSLWDADRRSSSKVMW